MTISVEFHHIFKFRVTDFLLSLLPSLPSGLNSNLNVPLDMSVGGSSGGGAVSYKESRLQKLWATDPLEQNSKPGTEELVFVTVHAVASNYPQLQCSNWANSGKKRFPAHL